MTRSTERLRHKIKSAADLKSVVSTMKNWAAVSIGPYEKAVLALSDYYRTVELGLAACVRQLGPTVLERRSGKPEGPLGIVVFGSDQGMVGQFNEKLAEVVVKEAEAFSGKVVVWPVGERIGASLTDSNVPHELEWRVPDSVASITPVVGRILSEIERRQEHGGLKQVVLLYNRSKSRSGFEPVQQRILPFDRQWMREIQSTKWPTHLTPQVRRQEDATFAALIREYLFISIFRACAESLASENATRLATMQGAEENIGKLQEQLQASLHQARQNSIDEELFDVFAGFEALQ